MNIKMIETVVFFMPIGVSMESLTIVYQSMAQAPSVMMMKQIISISAYHLLLIDLIYNPSFRDRIHGSFLPSF